MLHLPCEFSQRFHAVACQKGSTQWCRCGLKKVDTQHHKRFPARPQGVHHQPAITSVCYLSHFAPQDLIRGSLQQNKSLPTRQEIRKKSPLASEASAEKGLGKPTSELQATNAEEQHASCLKYRGGHLRAHRFQAGAGKIMGKEHSWRKLL